MERATEIIELYLAPDGRTLTREPRRLLTRGSFGSDDTEELDSPSIVQENDTLHLVYVGTKAHASINTVMGAFGSFAARRTNVAALACRGSANPLFVAGRRLATLGGN